MIQGITTTDPIKMLGALNAFKTQEQSQTNLIQEVSEGIDLAQTDILKNQNLDEIKQIAQNAVQENISDDDIKYGLTYGRSVIADYVA